MIRDLSATLQAILSDPVMTGPFPELSHALIAFDRPDDTFRPTQTMLDLFLFDVRENMELRSNEPRVGRQNGQVLINQAPMRVACTYLITAWPVGGTELALQEQRLLTQALQVLASCPRIPAPFLKGKLVGQEPPLPMMSAHHADELKNPAEFWAAIGNRMRASVTVTATISLDVFPLASVPMAKSAMVRFGERVVGAEQLTAATKSESFYIGGRVTKASNPVAGAAVTVAGSPLAARTDTEGKFVLGAISAGNYMLNVQSGAGTQQVAITVPAPASHDYDIEL